MDISEEDCSKNIEVLKKREHIFKEWLTKLRLLSLKGLIRRVENSLQTQKEEGRSLFSVFPKWRKTVELLLEEAVELSETVNTFQKISIVP